MSEERVFTEAANTKISDSCRSLHGDEVAINEALEKMRHELRLCLGGWHHGQDTVFHVRLVIERNKLPRDR